MGQYPANCVVQCNSILPGNVINLICETFSLLGIQLFCISFDLLPIVWQDRTLMFLLGKISHEALDTFLKS